MNALAQSSPTFYQACSERSQNTEEVTPYNVKGLIFASSWIAHSGVASHPAVSILQHPQRVQLTRDWGLQLRRDWGLLSTAQTNWPAQERDILETYPSTPIKPLNNHGPSQHLKCKLIRNPKPEIPDELLSNSWPSETVLNN